MDPNFLDFNINKNSLNNDFKNSKLNTEEFGVDFASILAEFDVDERVLNPNKKSEGSQVKDRIKPRPNPINIEKISSSLNIEGVTNINHNTPLSKTTYEKLANLVFETYNSQTKHSG